MVPTLLLLIAACERGAVPAASQRSVDPGEPADTAGGEPRTPYLIVTVPSLLPAAEEWAAWREADGYDVTVRLSEELTPNPSTAQSLSAAVAERASAWADAYPDAVVHILLLGDVAVDGDIGIPVSTCVSSLGDCYTDNEYVGRKLGGVPRYAVGRVPASDGVDAFGAAGVC